uniref:Expressed conserved protein n=1 Tax=Panagrellus redivivus TaxID=6233 RepID=A0A7E4UVH4_PANRE
MNDHLLTGRHPTTCAHLRYFRSSFSTTLLYKPPSTYTHIMSASERRRCGSCGATTMTSVLYLLLAMFGVTAALPSTYMQLFSQGPILDSEGKAILYEGPMAIDDTVPPQHDNLPRDNFVILPAGNPFSFSKLEGDDRPAPNGAPVKRSPSSKAATSSKMMRLARNLPQNLGGEKMYQISNIGDLPMFRFGK